MRLPQGVDVHERDQLDTVQQGLRTHSGVSVLIYDQQCAIEKRRERKRITKVHARQEIYVSKDICEACGDCGVKSNCMSIGWRDTPFGRKVEVQTASCNQDLACVDGECPSFFVLTDPRKAAKTATLSDLPEPALFNTNARPWHALFVGVGGTGVVTVSAIVSHAAWIESQPNVHLDQTGMAQKGGAVVSHLVIGAKADERPARIGRDECDLLIAFDALSAITRDLSTTIDPTRTLSIINTAYTPAAREVGRPQVSPPAPSDWPKLLGYSLDASSESVFTLDTSAQEIASLVSPSSVNLFVLGVACQRGLLPVRAASIEQAIRLNDVSVDVNIDAFRLGRAWVHRGIFAPAVPLAPKVLSRRIENAVAALGWPTDLCDALSTYATRLAEYDSVDVACAYLSALGRVVPSEIACQYGRIAAMIARLMFSFRYLKDEYEVARLAMGVRHEVMRERGYAKFGLAIKITPPWRRHAPNRKWSIPEPFMRPLFAALAALKVLRHTPFDPFAWRSADRRERATTAWFDAFALRVVARLTSTTEVRIAALLEDISQIRGYGSVRVTRLDEIIPLTENALTDIESEHASATKKY
jgi:indolepyruvate ferredoxin oxidoreductase